MMLKVYADFENAKKLGKSDDFTVAELVNLLNDQSSVMTADQTKNVNDALNARVEKDNKSACDSKCDELCKMERVDMWRSYAPNPYYMGTKIVVDKNGVLGIQDAKMLIKFKALEKYYQILHSIESDPDGKPRPNPAVTLCADASYEKLVTLFNGMLAEETASELDVAKLTRSKKMEQYLKDSKLDCFLGAINKGKRLAQLQAIWNVMLPKELAENCTALSCDMKYLKIAANRAKQGSVKGIGDRAMVDEIIVTISKGLSYDGKARTSKYEFASKSKMFASEN